MTSYDRNLKKSYLRKPSFEVSEERRVDIGSYMQQARDCLLTQLKSRGKISLQHVFTKDGEELVSSENDDTSDEFITMSSFETKCPRLLSKEVKTNSMPHSVSPCATDATITTWDER